MLTALVVGASGTLGSAIARELLARNYALGLHYCSRPAVCEQLVLEAQHKQLPACSYAADFRTPDAPERLASAFLKDFARLDALIWAAGVVQDAPLSLLAENDLRAQLALDLKAVFLAFKAFSRQLLKQKCGSVVVLSSHAGVAGRSGGSAYAMAHAGLLALIRSAAREWGPLGVKVNAVLPPFIPDSGMGRQASAKFSTAVQAKRALKSEYDGAAAVAKFVAELLANPASSGQVLSVDSRLVC